MKSNNKFSHHSHRETPEEAPHVTSGRDSAQYFRRLDEYRYSQRSPEEYQQKQEEQKKKREYQKEVEAIKQEALALENQKKESEQEDKKNKAALLRRQINSCELIITSFPDVSWASSGAVALLLNTGIWMAYGTKYLSFSMAMLSSAGATGLVAMGFFASSFFSARADQSPSLQYATTQTP